MARKGEEQTKAPGVPFKDIHPMPTTNRSPLRGFDLPADSGVDGLESNYKRCNQCGFICNTARDSKGSGYGNEVAVLKSGSTTVYNNVTVSGGCPFCGSSEY